MSEPQTGNASPNSRKRSLPEEDLGVPSTPVRATQASPTSSCTLSTPQSVLSVDRSPLLSRNAGSQENPYDLSGNDSVPGERHDSAGSTNNDAVPTKRRKLTVQEKEEKKREKEEKERQRAEQRAKRDEEKQLKGEERRKKNEEKEEKQRQKDLEKQQKEEALRKKERSQMRLASFFTKPATPQSSRPSLARSEPSAPDVKGKSVSFVAIDNPQGSPPRTVSPHKKFFSEYELFFLPFELPSNVTCAPVNAFIRDDEEIQTKRRKLDHHIEEPLEESSLSIRFHVPQEQRQLRGERTPPVRQIMECLHGTSANPIDLTQDASTNRNRTPMDELLCIPMKYLHFGEDVRPPYYGTYTKIQSRHEGRRLARNPFSRTLPEADYSYDSEAEWEEPEEGEDLDSEDDEDVESVGSAEDMQGFLDDEDAVEAAKSRRGHIAGSLEPVCSGLHWEDAEGVLRPADPSATSVNFTGFRMGTLLESSPETMDPFSTVYWVPEPAAPSPAFTLALNARSDGSVNGHTNSFRQPLLERPDGKLNGANSRPRGRPAKEPPNGAPAVPKPPKRLVPPEVMEEFKLAVQGSDLTKLALVEMLKKRFPKIPKDAINNTLSTVAGRVGVREAEKRWVVIPDK